MTASPGAVRAAEHIHSWQQIHDWPEGSTAKPAPRVEAFAEIIDRETNMIQLLEAIGRMLHAHEDAKSDSDRTVRCSQAAPYVRAAIAATEGVKP